MLYQRSLEIEQRLDEVLRLICGGEHSTPSLAREVGVSIPTISRYVAALRQRGHDILATREGTTWRYTCNQKVELKAAARKSKKAR